MSRELEIKLWVEIGRICSEQLAAYETTYEVVLINYYNSGRFGNPKRLVDLKPEELRSSTIWRKKDTYFLYLNEQSND